MKTRIITGLVGVAIVLAILYSPVIVAQLFVILAAGVAAREFILLTDHNPQEQWVFFIWLTAILLLPLFIDGIQLLLMFGAVASGTLLVYWVSRRLIPLWFLEGILYIGIPLATLIALRSVENGREWIMIMLAATWTTDTMALFGGKRFGRTPLTSISPNKTREGTFIGITSAFLVVIAFSMLVGLWETHQLTIVLAAILLPPLAVIGDLVESKIKRTYGKKDSGTLIPGHGGVLDRIDSMLMTTPALWLLLLFTV